MKNEKKLRLPLAHTAFMLYSVDIAHFLTTVTFHFSVDHLIDALVRLAFHTVSLIVLVAVVLMFRARRRQRGAQG